MKVHLPWQHDTGNYGVLESTFLHCSFGDLITFVGYRCVREDASFHKYQSAKNGPHYADRTPLEWN